MGDPYFEKLLENAREDERQRRSQAASVSADARRSHEQASQQRHRSLVLGRSIGSQLVQRGIPVDHRLSGIEHRWRRWPRSRLDSTIVPITRGWLVAALQGYDECQTSSRYGVLLDGEGGLTHFEGPNTIHSTANHTVLSVLDVHSLTTEVRPNDEINDLTIHQGLANLAVKYGITDL